MKEIGLRKAIGATRFQLLRQFLGESFLITLLAAVLALMLFNAALPFYNQLTGRQLRWEQLLTFSHLGLLLLLVAFIGLLAGAYPAWFVAGFNTVSSLKGKKHTGVTVTMVRKSLIVFQFAISVFMLFGATVMYRQLRFFHDKDLGFDKEQLVAVTMYGDEMWKNFGAMITNMQQHAGIAGFGVTSNLPGERFGMYSLEVPGAPKGQEEFSIRAMWGNEGLLPAMGIPLKAGRNFTAQFPEIKQKEFILNEAAVKALGLKDPVGQKCILDGDSGTVVGTIPDFNFASLHSSVEPLVIQYNPYRANYLLVKARAGQLTPAVRFLESRLKRLAPGSVFTYTFVDDKLNRLYEAENRMMVLFRAFAAFAVFVSCLGLFGLSAYTARLRTKEVGIRKVLGASVYHVTLLLSGDFIKLVLVAVLLAWPLAGWMMSRWLEGFAYRIHITPWMFVLSGLIAVLVAMLTVSFQAVKAALLNPVKSLQTE